MDRLRPYNILFSDTNILIDLLKTNLLFDFLSLDVVLCTEQNLFDDELILPPQDKLILQQEGLRIVEAIEEELQAADFLQQLQSKLSFYDCLAYQIAKRRAWVLLTGDGPLRKYAENNGVEVHGLLWVMDLCRAQGIEPKKLTAAVKTIYKDRSIRIPKDILKEMFPEIHVDD